MCSAGLGVESELDIEYEVREDHGGWVNGCWRRIEWRNELRGLPNDAPGMTAPRGNRFQSYADWPTTRLLPSRNFRG